MTQIKNRFHLESQLQPKLNIPRWTRRRNRSERRAAEIALEVAEVGAIERVEDISLEPQLKPLSQSEVDDAARSPTSARLGLRIVPTPQVPRRVSGAIANASRLAQLFGPRSPSSKERFAAETIGATISEHRVRGSSGGQVWT